METGPNPNGEVTLAWLLIQRLERLSADSTWAHQASGYRGALLKCLDGHPPGSSPESARLLFLIEQGFTLLEKAAIELTDLNPLLQEVLRRGSPPQKGKA